MENDTNKTDIEIIDECFDALGFDVDSAIEMTGDEETYVEVLREYLETAEIKAAEIESFYHDKNMERYIIAVHSMKSVTRMIGAISLSEQAKRLEYAEKDGNEDIINLQTESFLSQLRIVNSKLKDIVGTEVKKGPMISEEEFYKCLLEIKEAVSVFDFDTADLYIDDFKKKTLPDKVKDIFERVKILLADVDRDGIIEYINSLEI